MSLIPRNNNSNNFPAPFSPFPQDFWDNFFSHHHPLRNLLSPFPFFSPPQTVPYTDLSISTSGEFRGRLECRQIPECHLIVAELSGVDKHAVEVTAEDGGFVRIGGGGFEWRMRMPEDARVDAMSWSVENGVLTVVVPKFAAGELGWGDEGARPRDVRVVEITGDDD